jgi:hypothetical protein
MEASMAIYPAVQVHTVTAFRTTFDANRLTPYTIVFRDGEDNVHDMILTTDAAVALASSLRMCVDAADSGLRDFDAGKFEQVNS